MNEETNKKIRAICQQTITSILNGMQTPIADNIATAITEGYKLGWNDAMKYLQEQTTKLQQQS